MKRFISLLIAFVLLVSMFALPTFALAENSPQTGEEETEKSREFVIRTDEASLQKFVAKFQEYVIDLNPGLYVEMGKKFKLNQTLTGEDDKEYSWLNDETAIKELFPDINYRILPEDKSSESDTEHKVTYSLGEGAKEDSSKPPEKSYKKTQRVTLPSATTVQAATDYKFVGWLVPVEYDGTPLEEGELYLYRAGEEFSMPDKDIDVKAYFEKEESKSEDGSGEAQGTAEEGKKYEFAYEVNDIICLEYCTPSDDPRDENWTRVKADSEIALETSGWWMFRYSVVDGTKDISDDDAVLTPYNDDNFKQFMLDGDKYRWEDFCLKRYAVDTAHPEIALSSSMTSKMEEGLEVGKTYTISTSLDITDSSSTTTTYVVYKQVGKDVDGADKDGWLQIYDSTTKEVAEGYENCISTSGVITPLNKDVTEEGQYRYKIVYSVKDANGYFGIKKNAEDENGTLDETGNFHPTLLLGVHLSKEGAQTKAKMAVWKIVLFVIAGLSAVGIVVLLLIKPKQAESYTSRLGSASGSNDTATDEQSDEE